MVSWANRQLALFRRFEGVRSVTREKNLEFRSAVDHIAHEPACGHDFEPKAPYLLQSSRDQAISERPSAHRHRHLGVVDGHDMARESIIGDGKAGRRVELKPALVSVVTNNGALSVWQRCLQGRVQDFI